MARKGARTDKGLATPVYEQFLGLKHNVTAVGTSVLPIPATNLTGRKAMLIQNKHASAVVYIGGGIPYIIRGSIEDVQPGHDKRDLEWFKSTTGNEWYLALSGKADPGLTQGRYLYYATIGGSETLATLGTVGSLAAEHGWGWGDGDTLGYNTIYMRTNGATPANSPKFRYESIHVYYFVLTADDTAATGGYELGPRDGLFMTIDGSARVFAISDTSSTPVATVEFL